MVSWSIVQKDHKYLISLYIAKLKWQEHVVFVHLVSIFSSFCPISTDNWFSKTILYWNECKSGPESLCSFYQHFPLTSCSFLFFFWYPWSLLSFPVRWWRGGREDRGQGTHGRTDIRTYGHKAVGAASQWWSDERMMVYFKLMMVKCSLMMVKCLLMMVKC